MKEIEDERRVDAINTAPVLNIQKGPDGDVARDEVELFKSWDEALAELEQTEHREPDGSFDAWFDEILMSRLADAMNWMRYEIKCRCFLNKVNGGFCCLGVLSVDAAGLVLGCTCGATDDASRSVTWSICFVPISILMDQTLKSDQLGERILDLDSKITAILNVDYNPDEDEDLLGEPDPDDEEAYVRERCENFSAKEETI